MAHLTNRVRQVVILLQEIKGAEGQQLKADAHVAMIVEPVEHLDTQTVERDRNG